MELALQVIGAVDPVGARGSPSVDSLNPRTMQQEAVELFEMTLHGAERAGTGVTSVPTDPRALADRIFGSLESMRADYQTLMGRAQTQLELGPAGIRAPDIAAPAEIRPAGSGPVTTRGVDMAAVAAEMRELLHLQLNLGHVMVQEELVSKIAGRSTQNVDTLLRGQ